MVGNDYLQKFKHECQVLAATTGELSAFFPKLIESVEEGQLSETNPETISYQVFEDIKYDNIMSYHHKNSMLPEPIAVHLFKGIVKAVRLLNSIGSTFYCLNPTYIMIDQDLNPIFMDLSNVRKLSSVVDIEQVEDFQITKSFEPPEILKKKGTFSLLKMDSYQLGVLAMSLLLTAGPPFEVANNKDPFYKIIMAGEFGQFFKIRLPNKAVGKELQELLENLIGHVPEARIDPKDVENTKWWESANVEVSPAQLDAYIARVLELKQKQQLQLKSLVKSPAEIKHAFNALFRSSFSSRCSA